MIQFTTWNGGFAVPVFAAPLASVVSEVPPELARLDPPDVLSAVACVTLASEPVPVPPACRMPSIGGVATASVQPLRGTVCVCVIVCVWLAMVCVWDGPACT